MSMVNEYKFVFKQIVKNQKRFLKSKLGNHTSTVGATHLALSADESVAYINEVFNDYLQYGGLSEKDINNKIVLEVGPGDNFGVALKFLSMGARKVFLIDKFYSERSEAQQLRIYKKIRESLNEREKEHFDASIKLEEHSFSLDTDKIEYVFGIGLEESGEIFKNGHFDFIISRAVIQEISDTKTTFKKMFELLRKGGTMLHKIDLRDYGAFSKRRNHQLGSLMYSSLVYKLMTNQSGLPNRRRVNHYRELLNKFGFQYKMFITHIFGVKEKQFNPHKLDLQLGVDYKNEDLSYIESVKNNLSKEFRKIATEDLLISGFFLIADKK